MSNMIIKPPSVWICQCGAETHTTTGLHPEGWEWHGSLLLCADCHRMAAFSHGRDRADLPSAATPVRGTGAPDDATSILLRSGVYLDLADPDCTRIAAIDIASGLRQMRFAGQLREPYTIAQHSLLVMDLVAPVARQIGGSRATDLVWCALLHDAPEAFIHDITRPLKAQLPDYKRIEARLEKRFAAAFGMRWTSRLRQIVKLADLQALAIERRDLCPHTIDKRDWPVLQAITPEKLGDVRISRVWGHAEAEDRFLEAFYRHQPIAQEIAA